MAQDILARGLPLYGIDTLEVAREHLHNLLRLLASADKERMVVGLNDCALNNIPYGTKVDAHTHLGALALQAPLLALNGYFEAVGVSVQAAALTLVTHKGVCHLQAELLC